MSESPRVPNRTVQNEGDQVIVKDDVIATPLPPSDPPSVTELEAYYHSLYHLVAHWAAYVAMLGVLLTIAFLLCLTPISDGLGYRRRILAIGLVVICSSIAATYFIQGMKVYGAEALSAEDPGERPQTMRLKLETRSYGLGARTSIHAFIIADTNSAAS